MCLIDKHIKRDSSSSTKDESCKRIQSCNYALNSNHNILIKIKNLPF